MNLEILRKTLPKIHRLLKLLVFIGRFLPSRTIRTPKAVGHFFWQNYLGM